MNVSDAVRLRKSVRAFRPDAVPEATVAGILDLAARAPSGGNLQPWKVYALTGAPLAAFKSAIARKFSSGEVEEPEYAVYPPNLWDPYVSRRTGTRAERYAVLEGSGDAEKTHLLSEANFRFFGAPVGLFFCIDRKLGPPQWMDLGMYMQTVMLLAVEQGLDTCPQEIWARWPVTIRNFLRIPETYMFVAGMALGFRDPDHPLNGLSTARASMDEFAELVGFH